MILVLAGAAMAGGVALPASAQDQQALVARGAYLVNGPAACGNCHTQKNPDLSPRNDMFLAGGERFDTPVFTAYSRNLTPDKDSGIGIWTDAADHPRHARRRDERRRNARSADARSDLPQYVG